MATYSDIQRHVKVTGGFVPKTCWIADVKSQYGLTSGTAPNRLNTTTRKYPCPPEKKAAIEAALKHFKMI
jgi:hypothetical protein